MLTPRSMSKIGVEYRTDRCSTCSPYATEFRRDARKWRVRLTITTKTKQTIESHISYIHAQTQLYTQILRHNTSQNHSVFTNHCHPHPRGRWFQFFYTGFDACTPQLASRNVSTRNVGGPGFIPFPLCFFICSATLNRITFRHSEKSQDLLLEVGFHTPYSPWYYWGRNSYVICSIS